MKDQHALRVLKRLLELAEKANASAQHTAMSDVFDSVALTNEWLEAWNMARAVVTKSP